MLFRLDDCKNKFRRLVLDGDFKRRVSGRDKFGNLLRIANQPDAGIPAVAPDDCHRPGNIVIIERFVDEQGLPQFVRLPFQAELAIQDFTFQ